ncbi:hypothetical protein MIR68_009817 [Amoeboaphelidium protococcarum]|nr:hypothetical protein MIR68_009817 [Amoeboaphelidium protococcarum]
MFWYVMQVCFWMQMNVKYGTCLKWIVNQVRKQLYDYKVDIADQRIVFSDASQNDGGGNKLPLHVPICVLRDRLTTKSDAQSAQALWHIDIELSYEKLEIDQWTESEVFYSLLKQSALIATGNVHKWSKMSTAHHSQLWEAVQLEDLQKYQTAFREIIDLCSLDFEQPLSECNKQLKHIPVRIYTSGSDDVIMLLLPVVQDSALVTVQEILESRLFDRVDDKSLCVCAGVSVPSQSTLLWLYVHLHCPDGFLYLVFQ